MHDEVGAQGSGQTVEYRQAGYRAARLEPGHRGLGHAGTVGECGLAPVPLLPQLAHGAAELVGQPRSPVGLLCALLGHATTCR